MQGFAAQKMKWALFKRVTVNSSQGLRAGDLGAEEQDFLRGSAAIRGHSIASRFPSLTEKPSA